MEKKKTWDEQLSQCIQLLEKNESFEQRIRQLHFDNACEFQEPLIDKGEYIKEQCGDDPKERIRHRHTRPSKIKPLITTLISILLAALCVILFITAIGNSKKSSTLMDLKRNPGQGYEQWVNTWNNFSSFEELSETWYLVENDWEKQGVSVSWDDVLEIKNTYFSYGTIYSDNLLSKLTFEMSNNYSDKSANCYSWGIGLLLVDAIIFFFVRRGIKSDYEKMLFDYNEECLQNAQLANAHIEWERKVKNQEKKYEKMKKEYDEETKEMNARQKERENQIKEIEKEQESLNEQILEARREIWEKLCEADKRVPETKKYWNALFDYPEKINSDFFKSIRLYLKGDDFVSALLNYYKDWHERDLEEAEERRRENEEREAERRRANEEREAKRRREREEERYRMEKERTRLETERNRIDAERNRIERERTLAYEREQKENRRQQEQLAKKEAEYASARAQCSQCASFDHCISGKKNKNPYCMSFRRR